VLLLGAELRVARQLERLRERAVVLAAVVVLARRRLIRKRARRDEVLAPHVRAPVRFLGRDHVDQPLEVVCGFRLPGAAIRGDARRVGEDARGLKIDVRELVDADAHAQVRSGRT
jgi:hypothetical protein